MKRLFIVELGAKLVVAADDPDDAEAIGQRYSEGTDFVAKARPLDHLPDDWKLDEPPFGEDETSIGEMIEKGAAPLYSEASRRLARARKRPS